VKANVATRAQGGPGEDVEAAAKIGGLADRARGSGPRLSVLYPARATPYIRPAANERRVMRAETERTIQDIEQALALLRRHL
jgi:hypothetical protein